MPEMRTVATLIFPEFELLDVFGPLEMFGLHPEEFRLEMIAEDPGPVASTQGPRIAIDRTLDQTEAPEILLVPGGRGTRREIDNPAIISWLRDIGARSELITSVCTGSALLARAGLLDGRRATSNKRALDWVASTGPATDWQRAARWVEDGNVITSSGISAGIDMSLAVIGRLLGAEAAAEAAHRAEYLPNTDPNFDPFTPSDTKNRDPS
jgi:transcriptional regulator GlxA family with amidase domain